VFISQNSPQLGAVAHRSHSTQWQ